MWWTKLILEVKVQYTLVLCLLHFKVDTLDNSLPTRRDFSLKDIRIGQQLGNYIIQRFRDILPHIKGSKDFA